MPNFSGHSCKITQPSSPVGVEANQDLTIDRVVAAVAQPEAKSERARAHRVRSCDGVASLSRSHVMIGANVVCAVNMVLILSKVRVASPRKR